MSADQNEAYANFCAGADHAPMENYEREIMVRKLIDETLQELYDQFRTMGYPVCNSIGAHTVGASILEWVRQTGRGQIESCIALGQLDDNMRADALRRASSDGRPFAGFCDA